MMFLDRSFLLQYPAMRRWTLEEFEVPGGVLRVQDDALVP